MLTVDYHTPVLLDEVVSLLGLTRGSVVVDCNVGTGGHAGDILERISPDGRYIGIDVDADALKAARERLGAYEGKFLLFRANFRRIDEIVQGALFERVDAVLFDLGVSSLQLDSGLRGFSFRHDAPLDMRMDREGRVTAYDVINKYPKEELTRIFREYGEAESPGAAAHAIDRARVQQPIRTTGELLRVLHIDRERRYYEKIHPATKIFQAIRIEVNDEIGALEEALPKAVNLLRMGGRIGVISFHSLEDRIVKKTFEYFAKKCVCPPDFPICVCDKRETLRILTKKPVTPGAAETAGNPRARSAKLRVAEKIA
jgi:16S rRNA (cytosine1402-N4)-methyltransferase